MASETVTQLQLTQQNLQSVAAQKQQLESQLVELDSALRELSSAEESFKIIGKIMVAASKNDLTMELGEKRELLSVRLKNFTKQEEKLAAVVEQLQQEILKENKK